MPCGLVIGLLAWTSTNNSSRRALGDECAKPFGACIDSKCCSAEPTFGCHKRHGKPYAQCRRVPESGCNSQDKTWQCPSAWEECTTANYQNCWESNCCMDPNMACLRRGERHYAQCRPMHDCEAAGSEWKCPGTWKPPERPSAASSAAPAPPIPCTDPFQECTNTHCCKGHAFRCFEKKSKFFAQCIRPESCVKDANHPCNDIEGTPVMSPPPPHAQAPAQTHAHHTTVQSPPRNVPAVPQQQQTAAAAKGGGGGGAVTLILVFVLAVALGVGGVFVYLKLSTPKPPKEAPTPDDAMTPAAPSERMEAKAKAKNVVKKSNAKTREERESLNHEHDDDGDEGEEDVEATRKPKKKAPKAKAKVKTRLADDDDDVDGFD